MEELRARGQLRVRNHGRNRGDRARGADSRRVVIACWWEGLTQNRISSISQWLCAAYSIQRACEGGAGSFRRLQANHRRTHDPLRADNQSVSGHRAPTIGGQVGGSRASGHCGRASSPERGAWWSSRRAFVSSGHQLVPRRCSSCVGEGQVARVRRRFTAFNQPTQSTNSINQELQTQRGAGFRVGGFKSAWENSSWPGAGAGAPAPWQAVIGGPPLWQR